MQSEVKQQVLPWSGLLRCSGQFSDQPFFSGPFYLVEDQLKEVELVHKRGIFVRCPPVFLTK